MERVIDAAAGLTRFEAENAFCLSLVRHSSIMPEPTNITNELWKSAKSLFTQKIAAKHPPIRLLGFGVHGIRLASESRQQGLFEESDRDRQRKLDQIADEITAKFGKQALHRGRRPNNPQ